MKNKKYIFLLLIFLTSISVPYINRSISLKTDHVFGGFLLNPIDGNSYLAKMYEGWNGSWEFTLPYTSMKGEGSFLFIFYIFLGHLARWLNLPLILIFHLSRILCASFLFAVLWKFIEHYLPDKDSFFPAFILSIFGSGMGWILPFLKILPMDFWVAEAYPFLSAYANPHFPLSLGLILYGLILVENEGSFITNISFLFIGLLLANILPFAFAILGMLLLMKIIIQWKREISKGIIQLLMFISGGLPFLFYQYFLVINDPQLILWNQQNQTPAPNILNLLLSLTPSIFFAFLTIFPISELRSDRKKQFLLLWLIVVVVLLYLPFNLQRRFLIGIFIPVSLLAIIYLNRILDQKRFRIASILLIAVSLISNFIVITSGSIGIRSLQPILFLTKSEFEGLRWIEKNSQADDVILASKRIGMFLPAYTGRRVIYGHPFETINAEQNKGIVEKFFSCSLSQQEEKSILLDYKIDYLFWSSEMNQEQCIPQILKTLKPKVALEYSSGKILIYEIPK